MAIAIQPYSADLIPAVKAFNQRLVSGGVAPEFHFPENNIPHLLPKLEGRRIHQEYYLAVDGDCVRGGFILKYQDFFFHGKPQPVVYYHLPISEGIVNKDRKSTRLNSSHTVISYAVFCLKKKNRILSNYISASQSYSD